MNHELLKKEMVNIFVIDMDTLSRYIRRYKETGSTDPCKRTKCREKKISDEALREHILKNPSVALEERALFFSVKHQSVYARMKALGITRKKKTFLYEEREEEKRCECGIIKDEKEDNIVYIDESGIKNTLRNEYA